MAILLSRLLLASRVFYGIVSSPLSRSKRLYNFACQAIDLEHSRTFNVLGQTYHFPKLQPEDKVFIALSSGVDSSVVAGLLVKELRHPTRNLHPFYMVNWNVADPDLREISSFRRPPRKKPSLLKLVPAPPAQELKCTSQELRHVQNLCKTLGLQEPLELNLERDYWHDVFIPMVEDYKIGRTPNPDVNCNRSIKFGKLMEKLETVSYKIDPKKDRRWWLATGHYANIGYCEFASGSGHVVPHLLRSKDPDKDQTYYLSTIHPNQLPHLLFPLSIFGLKKKHVYSLARQWSLPGWVPGEPERRESMGLCFIEPGGRRGSAGFRLFLNEFLPPDPGDIVVGPELPPPKEALSIQHVDRPKNTETGAPPRALKRRKEGLPQQMEFELKLQPGTIIGRHHGLWTATIGERPDLDLPQGDKRFQGRWYVSRKFQDRNQIEVVRGWWNGRLWGWGVIVRMWHWLGEDCEAVARKALLKEDINDNGDTPQAEDCETLLWNPRLVAQFRHRQEPVEVKNIQAETIARCSAELAKPPSITVCLAFATPQRAVTHGQHVALWWRERCLGGGAIDEILWVEEEVRPDRVPV